MPVDDDFVGRQQELAQIRAAADDVSQGNTRFVAVEGFAGMGKTSVIRKAIEPYQHWQHINLTLDEEFKDNPIPALRQLLGGLPPEVDDVEQLMSIGLRESRKLDTPIVVTVDHLHTVEDAVAASLWRALNTLDIAPVLILLSLRITQRPSIRRLLRLADASPQGLHIYLTPFTTPEVRSMLSAATALPVNEDVARRVVEETDGIPLYTAPVARWLEQRPPGTRRIERALAETVHRSDHSATREAVTHILDQADSTTLPALKAMSLTEEPLSKPQLDELTGQDVDIQSLLNTHIVRWRETCSGYVLRYQTTRAAIRQSLHHDEQVALHRTLATTLNGSAAMAHTVAAMRLGPDTSPTEKAALRDELLEQAAALTEPSEIDNAYRLTEFACQLAPTEHSLLRLTELALWTHRMDALPYFAHAIRQLAPSAARSTLLAHIALERNDPVAALNELTQSHRLPSDYLRVTLFAQAVAYTSGLFSIRGLTGRGVELREHTLTALDRLEAHFQAERRRKVAEDPAAWEIENKIGVVAGQRALVAMWHTLSAEGPTDHQQVITDINSLLDEVEKYPTARFARRGLLTARGARSRQLGYLEQAYRDLSAVASLPFTDSYVHYAQAQLAMLLFTSGLWEEAETTARRAAGGTLTLNENSVSLVVYATLTLLPSGRAEDDVETLIDQLKTTRWQDGPMLSAILDWSQALRAAADGDHQAVAQHVMNMRDSDTGLWAISIDLIMVLGKSLHFSGRAEMLPSLLRSLQRDPTLQARQSTHLMSYVHGLERWAAGAPYQAMEHFQHTLEGFDAEPPMRPTQPTGEGGGLRLSRAMFAVDFAALVMEYPVELRNYTDTARELVAWGASVYQSCGVQAQVEFAQSLLEQLRPRHVSPGHVSPGHASPPTASHGSIATPTHAPDGASGGSAEQTRQGQLAHGQPADGHSAHGHLGIDGRPENTAAGPGPTAYSSATQSSAVYPSGVYPSTEPTQRHSADPSRPATGLLVILQSLSPREQQVALLVRRQLTNREIAEELVLSVRTVEYHVANILAKLEVPSRKQLRQHLVES